MSKAPNFSRHDNVEEEQVVDKPRIIFTIKEDSFDKAWNESQCIEEKPLWIDLYMKVGLFCGWSWKEFKETPYPVIKYINKDIDNKLGKALAPGTFFSWPMLFVSLAIARCFGGAKDD